jgi:hypothetical protein
VRPSKSSSRSTPDVTSNVIRLDEADGNTTHASDGNGVRGTKLLDQELLHDDKPDCGRSAFHIVPAEG